jgi:hypothetical protein
MQKLATANILYPTSNIIMNEQSRIESPASAGRSLLDQEGSAVAVAGADVDYVYSFLEG